MNSTHGSPPRGKRQGLSRRTFLRHMAAGTLAGTLATELVGCDKDCPEPAPQGDGGTPCNAPLGQRAERAAENLVQSLEPPISAAENELKVYLPDVYHENANGQPNWQQLAQAQNPQFFGAILKVTQGSSNYVGVPWFLDNWPSLRSAGGNRYGETWFRGSYHYLEVAQSGSAQAEYFLKTVEQAGGWGPGDLPPAVDVEQGSNEGVTGSQVVDTTSEWAETVKSELGCKVMLYGHTLMRDFNITSHMDCDYLWAPQYNDALTDNEDIGWPDNLVAFWQYTDGDNDFTSYPTSAPGLGPIDMNLFRPFPSPGDASEIRRFVRENGPGKSAARKGRRSRKNRRKHPRNR